MELYFFLTVNDKQSERGRPEDGRFAGVVSLVWLAGVPDDQVTICFISTLGYYRNSSSEIQRKFNLYGLTQQIQFVP